MKKIYGSKGFTLLEMLVVIGIIGLFSSTVLSSINFARAKVRDATRVSDLHLIQLALERYYDRYGTFKVAGTGSSGCGCGWLGYEGGVYVKAVTRGLFDEGFLSTPLIDDPLKKPGYMIYLCENAQVYALSATKEKPSAEDIAYIQTTCNGVGINGTYTVYGKNYARGSKSY